MALDSKNAIIVVECGQCNYYCNSLRKWGGYVYSKREGYDDYVNENLLELKNKMNQIDKEVFLNVRQKKEKTCWKLGILEEHFNWTYSFGHGIIIL